MNDFFSQLNLGGVNPTSFENDLKFLNLKHNMLTHIDDEIKFLESCNSQTDKGGFSTHLTDQINKRISTLKDLFFKISTLK